MDLDSLKYADLQKLAKSVGLKANIKADKLLRALKQHFEQEGSENGNNVTSDDVQCTEEAPAQPTLPSNALVTMRRGKNKNGKRKLSEDKASDLDPKLQESAVQDDEKSDDVEGEEGRRSSKRRKVSLTKDTETSVPPEKPKQNQAEIKESATKEAVTEKRNKDSAKKSVGKIPRHEGLMKKKAALRPTTPNFKKLHEAHFNKMESIDSYVQRKNKQMEVLRNSVKELKAQTENPSKPAETKTQAKPSAKRPALFSPGVSARKPDKCRVTPASKSALKSAPFKHTILSTNKVNVRFSQGTQDNEHKRSLLKTPARMSAALPLTPTSGRKSDVRTNPVNKTPGTGINPFIFSGSDTPGTNKKMFDLKASLSRPLTYKPHKGKLKPFGATQENAAPEKTQMVPSHQNNYKQHQVQTREERRVKHTEGRKQKKEKMLGARRGLVIA
ncbi:nucleolar and spindle-associated protein 1-like [Trichomycterus rosablanca]|uniref:nucleolar and spindle-associated protein 1-like n=1 Tax=Trichomycterus rosablanca TaxID=2290929 RepID=UPI002F35A18B